MDKRHDGRKPDEQRPVTIITGFQRNPAGSALIEVGGTRVLCAASVEENVPPWMRNQNVEKGWLTAEYQMLPSSTSERSRREVKTGPSGRTQEIQRLIGRSLRAALDMKLLGPRMIRIDCDVLDADGGTRCASITGGMVALSLAVESLLEKGVIEKNPIVRNVAAISAGVVDGAPVLDLDYVEDSSAEVDMNLVMGDDGGIIEIQATAEREPFAGNALEEMLRLAKIGIKQLFEKQKRP